MKDEKTSELIRILIDKNWNNEKHDYNDDCGDKDIALIVREEEHYVRDVRIIFKGKSRIELIQDVALRAISIIEDCKQIANSIDFDFWIAVTRDGLGNLAKEVDIVSKKMNELLEDYREVAGDPLEFYVTNNDWNRKEIGALRLRILNIYRDYAQKIRPFEAIADELRTFLRGRGMPEDLIGRVFFGEPWEIENFLLEHTSAIHLQSLKDFAHPPRR